MLEPDFVINKQFKEIVSTGKHARMNEYIGWVDNEYNIVLDHNQEIVRCCKCEHNSITDGTGIHCEIFKCFIGDLDFFCAWGEKREDE